MSNRFVGMYSELGSPPTGQEKPLRGDNSDESFSPSAAPTKHPDQSYDPDMGPGVVTCKSRPVRLS